MRIYVYNSIRFLSIESMVSSGLSFPRNLKGNLRRSTGCCSSFSPYRNSEQDLQLFYGTYEEGRAHTKHLKGRDPSTTPVLNWPHPRVLSLASLCSPRRSRRRAQNPTNSLRFSRTAPCFRNTCSTSMIF